MKTITISTTLKLKDGTVFVKGTELAFVRHSDKMSSGIFACNGREMQLRYSSVCKAPTIGTLEKWNESGVCRSVFGTKTEPDGYGTHGEPSWMLVEGII